MFDLLMREDGGAGVPVPLPGRVILFAGSGGALLARLPGGSVVIVGGGTGVIGYGLGVGGVVTQLVSKETPVTLNRPSGRVIMHGASLAGGGSVMFALNNSFFGPGDVVVLTGKAWSGRYSIENSNSAAGVIGIRVKNVFATAFEDPVEIDFAIIKGSVA